MSDEIFTVPIELQPKESSTDRISVCRCLISGSSSSEEDIPIRKQKIFSTVARTEHYLRERRIPELIRFLVAKILPSKTRNPANYVMHLLNECMVYRAGLGPAPVLFEERHLKAVVHSFDPGNRGWLSPGQVRRAFTTVGLSPDDSFISQRDRIPTDEVLEKLRYTQEHELYLLLCAGTKLNEETPEVSASAIP